MKEKSSNPFEARLQSWPIVHGNTLVTPEGLWPHLKAQSLKTGRVLWEYSKDLNSNIVLLDETIYALRRDGSLVGIDVHSGIERGVFEYRPQVVEEGSRETSYWIAAAAGRNFAYYGDSQELIALSK